MRSLVLAEDCDVDADSGCQKYFDMGAGSGSIAVRCRRASTAISSWVLGACLLQRAVLVKLAINARFASVDRILLMRYC
jgi:hypothetical protein